jgi:hypothetical protein
MLGANIFNNMNIFSSFVMNIRAEKKRLEKLAYEQRLKEERTKNYEELLERKAQTRKDEKELRKWEMMQRFKTYEMNCKFYEQRREKHVKDTEEIQKGYQKQIVSLCLYFRIFIHCTDVLTKVGQTQNISAFQSDCFGKPFGTGVPQLAHMN